MLQETSHPLAHGFFGEAFPDMVEYAVNSLFGSGRGGDDPPCPLTGSYRHRIIGLYAPTRQMGKSTFAAHLKGALEERGVKCVVIPFAESLRELAKRTLHALAYTEDEATAFITTQKDETRYRNVAGKVNPPRYSGRDYILALGDGCREIINPEAWVDAWERKLDTTPADTMVIVDDLRRENEYDKLVSLGASIHRIERLGLGTPKQPMEGLLEHLPFDEWHSFASLPDLYFAAEDIANKIASCSRARHGGHNA